MKKSECPLLRCLDQAIFKEADGKLLRFDVSGVSSEPAEPHYLQTLISKDTKIHWQAAEDLLTHAVREASVLLQGSYGLEILAIELGEGIQRFDAQAFASLLVNHSRKLKPGQSSLIQFGTLRARLKLRVPQEWGKVDLKKYVDHYTKDLAQLDLYLGQMLRRSKKSGRAPGEGVFVFHDLSPEPIFRFGDDVQTPRLRKMLEKAKQEEGGRLPRLYWVHLDSVVEFSEQFQSV